MNYLSNRLKSFFGAAPSGAQKEAFAENAHQHATKGNVHFISNAMKYLHWKELRDALQIKNKHAQEGTHKVERKEHGVWDLQIIKESGPVFQERHLWTNEGGNQEVYPLKLFKPTCLEHLIYIVKEAETRKYRIRAVGSTHAWSDAAVSTDYMIDTHGLNAVLPIEKEMDLIDQEILKSYLDPTDEEAIFQVEAGIRIRDLNAFLYENGLALLNMGGFDAQTIVGAASTSTHGTGVKLPPICDAFLSITLVTYEGKVLRIEPDGGITKPNVFKEKHGDSITLIQNDEVFHSVAVSMGAMGIIYSVILKVRKKYYLKEHRELKPWSVVKQDLINGIQYNYRHYDLIVNPYKIDAKDYSVIVTTRDMTEEPGPDASFSDTHRNLFYDLSAYIPDFGGLLNVIFWNFPKAIPQFIENGLNLLKDNVYIDRSYKVLNQGSANFIRACSSELSIPVDKDGHYIKSIEKIFELAARSRDEGAQYMTSPFAVRFVKASKHYLSMMHPNVAHKTDQNDIEVYCLIELPVISYSVGGLEILERIEKEMYAHKARPHWGQVNYVSGSHINLHKLYDKLPVWRAVFLMLNKNKTFSNEFTYRCGFDLELEFPMHKAIQDVKSQLEERHRFIKSEE